MADWMPPCAFAVLHEAGEPLVISVTRAPARAAAQAADRPAPPLPTTSTSVFAASALIDPHSTEECLIR